MEPNPNEVVDQQAPASTPLPVVKPEKKPKKSISLLLVIIGVVIVLLIGGVFGGYFFGKNSSINNIVQTPSPTAAQDMTGSDKLSPGEPKADATADWKTFKSSYGYSIKYPRDSELFNCEGKCNFGSQIKNKDVTITFGSTGRPNEESIRYFVENSLCHPIGDNKVIEKYINDIKFYQIQNNINKDNICLVSATLQPNQKTDNESYWIINAQVRAINQNGVNLFNQILSTFEFTN